MNTLHLRYSFPHIMSTGRVDFQRHARNQHGHGLITKTNWEAVIAKHSYKTYLSRVLLWESKAFGAKKKHDQGLKLHIDLTQTATTFGSITTMMFVVLTKFKAIATLERSDQNSPAYVSLAGDDAWSPSDPGIGVFRGRFIFFVFDSAGGGTGTWSSTSVVKMLRDPRGFPPEHKATLFVIFDWIDRVSEWAQTFDDFNVESCILITSVDGRSNFTLLCETHHHTGWPHRF